MEFLNSKNQTAKIEPSKKQALKILEKVFAAAKKEAEKFTVPSFTVVVHLSEGAQVNEKPKCEIFYNSLVRNPAELLHNCGEINSFLNNILFNRRDELDKAGVKIDAKGNIINTMKKLD